MNNYEKAINKIKQDQKFISKMTPCQIVGPTGPIGPTGPSGNSNLTNLIDGNNVGAVKGIAILDTYLMGQSAFATGLQTAASGTYSFSEGNLTVASGQEAHAKGFRTTASGRASYAEGSRTVASGSPSHAEGVFSKASGVASHAENFGAEATGDYSHAEGDQTIASGDISHAEGLEVSTNGFEGSHIMGKFGESDTEYSWFLGNGISNTAKGLAAKILNDGNAYIDGAWNTGGADYGEMFETSSGDTIAPGYFVTFDYKDKIKICDHKDKYILGVTSVQSGIIGNNQELNWKNKYEIDEWGQTIYHEVEVPPILGENGEIVIPIRKQRQPKLNQNWNSTVSYIPRSKRKEWITVGLVGKIKVRDDGSCLEGSYCLPNHDGVATKADHGYYVVERINSHQITIILK
ncbi:MAG: peptidase G2 autoproteolytic cleavage domain-containing protein [Bacilli bacterium]|nr:peptidase G2 autoproteolytic cleavage domain-containing protein [Bacilli bacterium]